MPLPLDSRCSFDSFIVGSANRLAAAAARRVAESPGTAYNPLFLYSASGLGKTHLVMAIGTHLQRVQPQLSVMYDTLEHLMDGVMSAIQTGERDAFRNQLREVTVLLLDDVQFLAGRRGAQEELLRAWDSISARGGQLVLASDRPPREIDGLDERLLSRFSGGLITDVGVPDYETRVAIVNRKAEERGQQLSGGVAEALARVRVANVRELQGALNRVLATQELEGRVVRASEIGALMGLPDAAGSSGDEFGIFLSEIEGTLGEVVARLSPEQLLADSILRFQAEGYVTTSLESALLASPGAAEADALVTRFQQATTRLGEIAVEIRALDPDAAELARLDLLRNPDRMQEAETVLGQVQARTAPLPGVPAGPAFEELRLEPELLPVRAARAVAAEPGERYCPFYVHGQAGSGKTSLLVALARELQARRPDLPLAFITGEQFAAELIAAISRHQVDSWRARYHRARVLVIDGVDALVDTERAQEELFHLYETVRRHGGQLVFSALRPPRELHGLEDRLRSRLESGLVTELGAEGTAEAEPPNVAAAWSGSEQAPEPDEWFLHSDKVLWRWPYMEETLYLELD